MFDHDLEIVNSGSDPARAKANYGYEKLKCCIVTLEIAGLQLLKKWNVPKRL